jgi:serine/threonine protein kinase
MGAVYKVWDLNLKRPRALKENLDITPEAQRQFEREALMLADLSHPNLPKVQDYFFLFPRGRLR